MYLIVSREISIEEGQTLAKKNNMLFYETSAKSGHNIENVFTDTARIINKKIEQGYYDISSQTSGITQGLGADDNSRPSKLIEYRDQPKKKKKCC